MGESMLRVNRKMYISFNDYEKALNRVRWRLTLEYFDSHTQEGKKSFKGAVKQDRNGW